MNDSPRAWTTSTAAPAPPLHGGENEISQVPGRPLRTCPALRPRRTADTRPLQHRRCDLPPFEQRRLRICTLSRLHHAACTLSVYASQPGSLPVHATRDSGWWPALTGQGFHLLGRIEGFRHVCPSTWLPPSPSFAWRNQIKSLPSRSQPRRLDSGPCTLNMWAPASSTTPLRAPLRGSLPGCGTDRSDWRNPLRLSVSVALSRNSGRDPAATALGEAVVRSGESIAHTHPRR